MVRSEVRDTLLTLRISTSGRSRWLTLNLGTSGAPPGETTIVSRQLTPEYWEDWCEHMFPPQGEYTYGLAKGRTVETLNSRTGGWFLNASRLVWVNGYVPSFDSLILIPAVLPHCLPLGRIN